MSRDVLSLPKKSTPETYRRRKQIGIKLRNLRERKDLTIEEVCVLAGVSFHTWSRWESGITAIPLERVADISRALKSDLVSPIRSYLQAA